MERTTLAVPVKFREMLNDNYDAKNDLERLKLWAREYEVSEEHGDVPEHMMIKVENMIEEKIDG
jgi:hypothetical protein